MSDQPIPARRFRATIGGVTEREFTINPPFAEGRMLRAFEGEKASVRASLVTSGMLPEDAAAVTIVIEEVVEP